MRIGYGFDIHALVEGRKLILGGVEIPFEKGLLGHSDADVLLHAISDALLGAVALGDIGQHFPPSNDDFKNMDSALFLEHAAKLVRENKARITHIDLTLI
ncbi:MAG: 2-C-methyl-D-erythritol 2,4-cyclodiphosphate synthase, partial [Balneolales bacterium]|nr:2-C-methyl-D-erythritol 2,4-cyclodiphosphate synthase [Balneolales bacterium]